jgi:hypothetical protein
MVVVGSLVSFSHALAQQTTAFTYQGQLADGGTNANGTYTLIFALYGAATNSNFFTNEPDPSQIGSFVTNTDTLKNGLFTETLDFGPNAFNGTACWLEITVQYGTNAENLGPLVSETLTPRVRVLPAPYAIFANTANTASNLDVNGGSVTFSNTFPQLGTSTWDVTNGFSPFIFEASTNSTNTESSLSFTGGSGLAAMQIFDDPQSATAGVFAPNFVGGAFFGDGSGLTNLNSIPNMQVFTNNGTFVVPTNVTRIMVELWGGGGGGGNPYWNGISDNTDIQFNPAGGGGAGGYGKQIVSVTPGSNYVVTVGQGGLVSSNGGNSSFGTLANASGGNAGMGNAVDFGAGGEGGTSDAAVSITGDTGYDIYEGGGGGAAGCGGFGGKSLYLAPPSSSGTGAGGVPGGGGAGGYVYVTPIPFSTNNNVQLFPGCAGGNGRVIVYY